MQVPASLRSVVYSPGSTESNVALKLWSLQCLCSLISQGAAPCQGSLKELKPQEKRFLNLDCSLKMWKEDFGHGHRESTCLALGSGFELKHHNKRGVRGDGV